jgi:hypothetical protein
MTVVSFPSLRGGKRHPARWPLGLVGEGASNGQTVTRMQ